MWIRFLTKNKKRGFPFFSLLQISPQTRVPLWDTFKFQILPELIIIKSYKNGKSRGRTRNPVISKMRFFLKTINDFRLLTIATKNSVLDVFGILTLPLRSGQKVITLPPFLLYLMLTLVKLECLLLTNNKQSIYFDDWIKKLWSKGCNAQFGIYLSFAMKMKIGIDPVCHVWLFDTFSNYHNLHTL